jgi:hypothetical protein
MTVDGLLAIVLTAAIPFVLAVLGGILAIKALPDAESYTRRRRWFIAFILLGVLGIGFAVWQQVRVTAQQKYADDEARAKQKREEEIARETQSRLEGDKKYTQGQLDSINKVLNGLVQSPKGNENYREIIAAVLAATSSAASKSNTPTGLKGLTNAQLRDKANEVAKRIDAIDNQYELDMGATEIRNNINFRAALLAAEARESQNFSQIRPETQIVYEELLLRLPPEVATPTQPQSIEVEQSKYAIGVVPLADTNG